MAADLPLFFQFLANGVVYGAILAMCAIGLTLVYGILNLSNFAHGDMLTFGAYIALFFGVSTYAGREGLLPVAGIVGVACLALPAADRAWRRKLTRTEAVSIAGFGMLLLAATAWVALAGAGVGTTDRILLVAALLSVAATVVLSLGMEVVLWRPLRKRGATVLSLVIASLGLSLVLRNALQVFFGGDYRSLERPVDEAATYLGVHISGAQWFTFASAIVIIGLVHVFLTYTKTGKAMRALADDRDLARACGIDVDRIILYVWAIAAALVAIAGVLLTLIANNNVNINMGFSLLIPIFAAVVLGGVGSPYGAMLGGFVVGIAMKLAPTRYDLAVAFVVLIAVLLVRPQGILGRRA